MDCPVIYTQAREETHPLIAQPVGTHDWYNFMTIMNPGLHLSEGLLQLVRNSFYGYLSRLFSSFILICVCTFISLHLLYMCVSMLGGLHESED